MTRLALLLLVALGGVAHAWDAPTHAGLTERAALASSLGRRLSVELGRPLGLYEPLALKTGRDELARRLAALDPEGGYAPDADGAPESTLGWLTAGAVIEDVPAERGRHHFFDPSTIQESSTGGGLDERRGLGMRTRLGALADGTGSLRGLFTGANFDGTGLAATAWLAAPRARNEWGLERFLDEREHAAAAATPAERNAALARALLAAGSIVHLVEDAGDPAYVRNDYRVALHDQARAFERFVAARYGRLAVPEPGGEPLARTHLVELWHDEAGDGLADRTQRRFFSLGTLPPDSRYPEPRVRPGAATTGYVSGAVEHLAAYRREAGGVRYGLDERCFADYATALLPEIGRYAAGALEWLFRGRLEVAPANSELQVSAREIGLGAGTLSLFVDAANGARRKIFEQAISGDDEGAVLATLPRPAEARHVTALFRGRDPAGEPLVIVREQELK
jgi:hypothetical protein